MSTASEENGSSAQAAEESNAQAAESNANGNAQGGATGSESQESNQDGETLSLDEARKLREENRKLRQRAKDAEGKLATAATADDQALTELEKLTRERDDFKGKFEGLNTSLRNERATSQAVELATKAGAINASAIARLIPITDVEFDDDGKPENVGDLIAQAKKDYPDLFRAAAGGGNGGSKDESAEVSSPLSRMARGYGKRK